MCMRCGLETIWCFHTRHFVVRLELERQYGYKYDGDDPDGETQAKLDAGEYVAFDSAVRVIHRPTGIELGADYLGGSVYAAATIAEFWTAHRDPNPAHRNCSLMRAARGDNVCIGHYFPGMVSDAIRDARRTLATMPRVREVRQ